MLSLPPRASAWNGSESTVGAASIVAFAQQRGMQVSRSRDSGWNAPRLRHKRTRSFKPIDDESRPCRDRRHRTATRPDGSSGSICACSRVRRVGLRRRRCAAASRSQSLGTMALGLAPAFAFDGSTSNAPEKIPLKQLHQRPAGASRRHRRLESRRRGILGRRLSPTRPKADRRSRAGNSARCTPTATACRATT